MRIEVQVSNISDKINLSGSILSIDEREYDLNDVKNLPVIDVETGETEDPLNQRVYKSGEETIIFLRVGPEEQFMFINNNLMRFYDINENKIIDMNELNKIVEHYNLPEEDRRAERKKILEDYLSSEKTKEDWKKKGIPAK